MWRCLECGEKLEPWFEVCWNCGTSREGDHDPDFKSADAFTPAETARLSPYAPPAPEAADSTAPAAPPMKFGLRTLFVAVTACALFFAVAAWSERPRTSDDFFELGVERHAAGKYPQAIAALTRAIELHEESETRTWLCAIYTCRAESYNSQGDFENAFRDITHAMAMDSPPHRIPKSGPFIFHWPKPISTWHRIRAEALIGLGELEQARVDLNLVLERDPTNERALDLLEIVEGRRTMPAGSE